MKRHVLFSVLSLLAACSQGPREAPKAPQPPTSKPVPAISAGSAGRPDRGAFLTRLATERPDVKWDADTFVAVDMDGDGQPEQAALGYVDATVVIAVARSGVPGEAKTEFLPFATGAGQQQAICGPDIKLDSYPLSCEIAYGGDNLPGCKALKDTFGLSAGNGDCDPVNLYWDHNQKRVAWWRN